MSNVQINKLINIQQFKAGAKFDVSADDLPQKTWVFGFGFEPRPKPKPKNPQKPNPNPNQTTQRNQVPNPTQNSKTQNNMIRSSYDNFYVFNMSFYDTHLF